MTRARTPFTTSLVRALWTSCTSAVSLVTRSPVLVVSKYAASCFRMLLKRLDRRSDTMFSPARVRKICLATTPPPAAQISANRDVAATTGSTASGV
jgi:hypothetical protein